MKITNTSGSPLTHSACAAGSPAGELAPGDSMACPAGDNAQTLQLIASNGKVSTLNFSNLATGGGSQATVQILIGL